MEQKKITSTSTANQVDGILQDYLDQLLITATAEAATPAPVENKITAPVVSPTVVSPPVISPTVEVAKVEQIEEPIVETAVETDVSSVSKKIQLPAIDWRDSQGVECLIFKISGLKLAIPLSLLGGVYPVNDKITPLFGQAKWSLGIWANEEQKLTIIDSALLMMPEKNISLADEGYNFFIQLDRSPWALACQEICDTVTLGHDAIKWRGENSKRPWLAGTVIDQMCALIDVPETLELLETQRNKSA